MTKEQAKVILKQLIDQVKLTRQEYQTVLAALEILAAPTLEPVKPTK